jgi:UDP-2-acetamido-2-deoxy-ribo-hexuluronate aminotransferase
VMERMKAAGVPTTIHYPRALHQQDVFKTSLSVSGSLPVSEQAAAEVLSLPMHPYLSTDDQQRVIAALAAAVRTSRP